MMRRLLSLLFVCSLAPVVMAQSTNLSLGPFQLPVMASAGALVNTVVRYSNNGPANASDVKLTLSVPPGTTYVGLSYYDPNPLTCTEPPKGGQGDVVCTASSLALSRNAYLGVGVAVFIDRATAPGTVITFPATLTASNATTASQTVSGSLTVIDPADISVAMSAPAAVFLGDTFQTTITVTNNGPGVALNPVVAYSTFAPGITNVTLNGPPGWSCSLSSCTIDSFPPGTATFTASTTPDPLFTSATSILARARVDSFSDPLLTNNIVEATTAIAMPPPTTLKVTLTAAPATVRYGDPLSYTAQITNTGNVDARAVDVQWSLNGSALACDEVGHIVCTIPAIAAGATQTLARTIVTGGPSPVMQMKLTVTALNVTFDPAIDIATVSTTPVIPTVDLQAGVYAPAVIQPGEEGLWRYSVTSNGPDTSTDWTLYFTLPSHTTFSRSGDDSSGAPGTCNTIPTNTPYVSVTCHGTTLAPGTSFQKSLYLKVDPSAPAGRILSSANVSRYPDIDPNSHNDETSVETQIVPASAASDVSVGVTAPSSVYAGDEVTFTIWATNVGMAGASNVTVQFTLPPSLALSFASPKCTGTAMLTCNAGTLAAHASTTFNVTARAVETGTATVTASITTTSPELNGDNNTGTATVAVLNAPSPADVGVTVGAAPATVQTGDDVTYTLTARNGGTATASNVTVHFGLPSSVTFVSASPGCTGASDVICTAATLDNGASAVFAVTARAVQPGSITTTATVSTTSFDPNNVNNSASATIVVNAPPARRRAARH
jgi:uncharacterized repeat protein (TIGR01451 family)